MVSKRGRYQVCTAIRVIAAHPFRSAQMYKKRFAAWGLGKNRRRVKPATREMKEKQLDSEEQQPAQLRDVCRNNRIPLGGEPHFIPDRQLAGYPPLESALHSISIWADGSFAAAQSPWRQAYQPWNAVGYDLPITYPSTRMYQDMALSHALLDRGRGQLAGLAVRKAFWQLEEVIKVGDPGMMRNLIDIFFYFIEKRQQPLIRMLLSQLASLARHRFPSGHPLVHYFQQLAKNEDDLPHVLKTTYTCFVGRFHAGMDDQFYWMYDNWLWDSSVRSMDTDPEADYTLLTEGLQALSVAPKRTESTAVSRSHLSLLKDSTAITSDSFSKTSAAEVLQLIQGEDVDLHSIRDAKVQAYIQSASIKRTLERADWETVRSAMQAKIERLVHLHGKDSREVIRELWSLEKVSRQAGDDTGASLIGEEALRRVGAYLLEVPSYME